MNPEELKIIEDERKKILNDILEELQTKSLKDLSFETSEKENRIEKVKVALEELYEDLHLYERWARRSIYKDYWNACALDVQEAIDEFENDYSNYIQGGEGFISEYLDEDESEPENENTSSLGLGLGLGLVFGLGIGLGLGLEKL